MAGFTLLHPISKKQFFMSSAIKRILVPVETNNGSLRFAGQAAELALSHGASLALLHVANPRECTGRLLGLYNFSGVRCFHRLTNEKTSLLHTWKQSLEHQWGVEVSVAVDWGNKMETITRHLHEQEIDLLLLKNATSAVNEKGLSWAGMVEIIDKSPCQVMTFLTDVDSLTQWKEIVIPVGGYIPEARIQAILGIARNLQLKIHLLNMRDPEKYPDDSDFYFITETLKRIKAHGRIQVECRHLMQGSNRIKALFNYAALAGADLLMTNMHIDHSKEMPTESFYSIDYA
jgi:nucleotide-binding universal stress UspA family protein